ncbi:hypothetical protein [Kitasatospora sp. NPDC086791]|uniref:hypothetical protein n=1 Tax=Kitasatospora sp. NPDC086791 TaxID=3155178 RepID=UPI003445AA34
MLETLLLHLRRHLLLRIALALRHLLLGIPLLRVALRHEALLTAREALLRERLLLEALLLHLLLRIALALLHLRHLLLGIPLLPVPVRLLAGLARLRVLLLPLAVLLAGDRLPAVVPGITGVPRLALGGVAPTQIGH